MQRSHHHGRSDDHEEEKYVVADRDAILPVNGAPPLERVYNNAEELMQTKVGELVSAIKIIDVMNDTSIMVAFDTLVDNKILSVPVYNVEKQKYEGFLDLVDIVHHFLEILTDEEIESGYQSFKQKFVAQPCGVVINKSARNPYESVGKNASVRATIALVDQWGVRRVPVVEASGDCVSILSQSKLVNLLANNIGLFSFAAMPISEFNLGIKDVYKSNKTDTARSAFLKMRDQGASAIAIVDDDDKLVDVLSVSDLRLLGHDLAQLHTVTQTVEEYASRKAVKLPPVCVRLTDTVASVSQYFQENHVHRIYVVDAEQRPVGVIGMGDYLRLFVGK